MKAEAGIKEAEQGYWLYADGFSYWGVAVYRYGELPVRADQQVHGLPAEKRVEAYAALKNPPKEEKSVAK